MKVRLYLKNNNWYCRCHNLWMAPAALDYAEKAYDLDSGNEDYRRLLDGVKERLGSDNHRWGG